MDEQRTGGGRTPEPSETEQLRAEIQDLRLSLAAEVRTKRVVVVDEKGIGRVRVGTDGDTCRIEMLDRDGFARVALTARPGDGGLVVSSRTSGEPTRVDVFALDAIDERDHPSTGIEVIDGGNSVGGLTVRTDRRASVWTHPLA